jgi:hypothetical protein
MVQVVQIRVSPIFDCHFTPINNDPSVFTGPNGTSNVTVLLGETVEWEYSDWLPSVCHARIVSRSAPPGGKAIDSGSVYVGGRFRFVPDVVGTSVFTDTINRVLFLNLPLRDGPDGFMGRVRLWPTGLFAGRFDPLDIGAFALGLLPL